MVAEAEARSHEANSTGDEELAQGLASGDPRHFEALMRTYNQRLFRAARAITGDDDEAEDAVQAAYLSAFVHAAQFAGRSSLGTWLTRIAINEALRRRRALRGRRALENIEQVQDSLSDPSHSPEEALARREQARFLEAEIDKLPPTYRLVLMLRQVQGLSCEDAAASLGVSEEVVRVRLHRARAMLRERLGSLDGQAANLAALYGFAGTRCNRIVESVLVWVEASVV